MIKKLSKGKLGVVVILFVVFEVLLVKSGVFNKLANAASITTVRVALDAETVSTATGVAITFNAVTPLTANSVIEVTYDTGFTGGAALTAADVTITGGTIGTCTESNFIAGYFRSTCAGTASAGQLITIDIDGTNDLTTPATAGNYNFGVAINIGGTGTTYDYGAGLAYVADDNDVLVTAIVPPVIDMEIYQQNSGTMTNACALGVLSLSEVKSCIYDVAGATNNNTGLTIRVTSDGALNSGVNTIDAVADGTVTAGFEEYGFRITEDAATSYDGGTYETGDRAVPTSETLFASTTGTIDGITTVASRLEVTHRASMATNTVVGTYDQVVTYTAFTN